MNPLFWSRYIARSLRRGGSRTVFALLCVIVGVAGVVALQIASLTIQSALTSNVRAANGGDISVVSDAAPLSPGDLGIFRRLQSRGAISSWTAVSTVHATAVGPSGRLVPFDVNVVTSPPYPLGGQPTFVSPNSGNVEQLLAGRGDVLVTSVLADELGVSPGSRVLASGLDGTGLHATVRGILAETSFAHTAAMVVSKRDAVSLTSRTPRYTAVYANTSRSPGAIATSLRSSFPTATVQTVTDALNQTEAQVHDFRQFMLLVGLFALLIAGVGILNAMQSSLARRRLEIAMLKALGFGRWTLYTLFGGEAAAIGIAGGVIGTLLGAVMSKVIADALARALALQVAFVLDRGTLLSGVGLGVGAAVIFALLPIIRAAGYRPIEMLREGTGVTPGSWLVTLGLLGVVVVLFAALAAVTLGDTRLAAEFVVGAFVLSAVLTGLFALAVGALGRLGPSRSPAQVLVLTVLLVATVAAARAEPALAAIIALATVLWGATIVLPESRLLPLIVAARSLGHRRTRMAVTLVALLAGMLAMTVTLTVALSLRDQINNALASNGSTNLVAVAGPVSRDATLRATRTLPGVKSRQVTAVVPTEPVAVDGRRLVSVLGPAPTGSGADEADDRVRLLSGLTGWDLRHGQGPANVHMVAGHPLGPADAGTNHVLVRSALADYPYHLRLGSTLKLRETGTGLTATVTVVGFYARQRGRSFGSFFTPPIYADQRLAYRIGQGDAETIASLTVDPPQLSHDAAALQTEAPGALVVDVADLTAVIEQILNELLDILAVITGLVLGAGVAVLANGVALSMLERRREVALYKAIGFEPARVLGFVLVENALVGTLAGAAAVLATAVALRVLSRYALQQAIGFDPLIAILVLLVAVALVMATAYATARRPLRVRPVEALRNE